MLVDQHSFPTMEKDDADAIAYFHALHHSFDIAAEAVGGVKVRDYGIGSYTIRLRFAGATLIPAMTPALAHLEIPTVAQPDFTISLWDSTSTQVMTPSPPWRHDPYAYGSHGEILGYSQEHIRIAFNMAFDALSLWHIDTDQAMFWVRDAANIPFWETAAPLRIILHWWLGSRGLRYIHAAAVGTPTAAALLVGKGGSGKSTTALTCLDSDLTYVSDDYCLLATEPEPRAYSLYNSAKLKPDNHRLPHLLPLIHNTDRASEDKPFILLHQHYPEKIVPSLPLKAILVPRVTGRVDTTVQPASAAMALLALAPSTIFQLPGASSTTFQDLAALVKTLPCYVLELGTDLSQIPQVIAHVLEGSES